MCANSYKNISITEKDILEYLQRIELNEKIPSGNFHVIYKDLLLQKINAEEYKSNFPKACELLNIAYFTDSKLDVFLSFVNENGYIPKDFDAKFFDGRSILRYWRNNKNEIFRVLFEDLDKEGFQLKYPIAFAIIKDRYKTYQNTQDVIKYNKNKENKESSKIIEDVEEPLPKKSKKEYLYYPGRALDFIKFVDKFGDIPAGKYHERNKEHIMKFFDEEHYRLLYPIAYEVLSKYTEYKKLSFEEKSIELINYIEMLGRNIAQKEEIKFSNGDDMYGFWCAKRLEIIEYFMTNFDKNEYFNFYQVVMHYKVNRLIKKDTLIYYFLGYVNSYHIIGNMPLTREQTMLDYWDDNKEVLYYMALSDYLKEYPSANEIIIRQYEDLIKEEYKK